MEEDLYDFVQGTDKNKAKEKNTKVFQNIVCKSFPFLLVLFTGLSSSRQVDFFKGIVENLVYI